jgi:hypothetical protein
VVVEGAAADAGSPEYIRGAHLSVVPFDEELAGGLEHGLAGPLTGTPSPGTVGRDRHVVYITDN